MKGNEMKNWNCRQTRMKSIDGKIHEKINPNKKKLKNAIVSINAFLLAPYLVRVRVFTKRCWKFDS